MTRSLIKLSVVLLVCVVGVGLARGWFAFSKSPDADSNKVNINLTVDPHKMKQDVEKVKEVPSRINKEAEKPGEHPAGERTSAPQHGKRQE